LSNAMEVTPEEKKKWYYESIHHVDKCLIEEKAQTLSSPPMLDDNDKFTFSFTHPLQNGPRLLFTQIESIIDNAIRHGTYLLACSFMVNNAEVLKKLADAAKNLPGKVYVLVGNKTNVFFSTNKEYRDENEGLSTLAKAGALVRYMQNAHLKFITNGKESLICTANFSTEGLFKNPEFGIGIRNEGIGAHLNRLFSYLWNETSDEMLVNDNWLHISKDPKNKYLFKMMKECKPEIVVSAASKIKDINQKQHILVSETLYQVIVKQLETAKNSIDLAVYLFDIFGKKDLERISDILIAKVKSSVNVRILVPSIKTQVARHMKDVLEKLKNASISVRYYRELHGKCLIIDKQQALLFTGNIDRYLVAEDSCDIGILVSDPATVRNFCTFFDHLWADAAVNFDVNAPVDLHVDLVIKSREFLSPKNPISIPKLKERIGNSKNIQFYHHESGSMLKITVDNDRSLNLYMTVKGQDAIEMQEEILSVSGILDSNPKMKIKEANLSTVKNLSLKLIWAV